jgi:chromosome segregation ATPase
MKLMSALAAVSALTLAQDAGVPDAGMASAPQPQQQQRTVTVTESPELVRIRSELQAMRAQNIETQTKLDAAVRELQQVRSELAQARQAQADRERGISEAKQAAMSISAVDQQLGTGTTDVDGTLRSLESMTNLGPNAKANLEAARAAINNSDLMNARLYLQQAAAAAATGH